jgi:hypothetical protein
LSFNEILDNLMQMIDRILVPEGELKFKKKDKKDE